MIHGLDAHLCSGVGYGGGVGGCDWQATTIAADATETSATVTIASTAATAAAAAAIATNATARKQIFSLNAYAAQQNHVR